MKISKLLQCSLSSVSHQFKWRLQPRNEEKVDIWKGSDGRIRKDHQEQRLSLETKDKIIHTLIFPTIVYGCKKLDSEED